MEPRYPVMPSDGKMACVMTPAGLRLAGQVELAGLGAAPNWQRAEVLLKFARKVFPAIPADLPPERVKLWMGHRPSTPDGSAVSWAWRPAVRISCMRSAMGMSG